MRIIILFAGILNKTLDYKLVCVRLIIVLTGNVMNSTNSNLDFDVELHRWQ